MPDESVFIALGSNIGSRHSHLRFALKALMRLPSTRLKKISSFHETLPVGGPPQKPFLNAAAHIRTQLSPMALLVELKRIEALRGRRLGPRWGPRPLDCDILFYGKRSLKTKHLIIPHPYALRRAFVLRPLSEIVPPAWSPPGHPRQTLKMRLLQPSIEGRKMLK